MEMKMIFYGSSLWANATDIILAICFAKILFPGFTRCRWSVLYKPWVSSPVALTHSGEGSMKENPLVQQDFFSIEFVCWSCSLIAVGCRSRGRMPVTITCSFGAFSCSFQPQAMTPSAMSCGLYHSGMLLVPHKQNCHTKGLRERKVPHSPEKMLYGITTNTTINSIKGL